MPGWGVRVTDRPRGAALQGSPCPPPPPASTTCCSWGCAPGGHATSPPAALPSMPSASSSASTLLPTSCASMPIKHPSCRGSSRPPPSGHGEWCRRCPPPRVPPPPRLPTSPGMVCSRHGSCLAPILLTAQRCGDGDTAGSRELMPSMSPPSPRRVFGFKDIILYSNCSRPNALQLNTDHPWPVYANPGILLLLYYTVATLLKLRRLDARVRGCGAACTPMAQGVWWSGCCSRGWDPPRLQLTLCSCREQQCQHSPQRGIWWSWRAGPRTAMAWLKTPR